MSLDKNKRMHQIFGQPVFFKQYIARPDRLAFENMTLATFASNNKYATKKVKQRTAV